MTTELSPGEQAYLDSGGTDAAGLIAENDAAKTEPVVEAAKVETPKEIAADAGAAKVEPAADAAPEPGEEEIPAADGKSKRRMVDSRALKAERLARTAAETELKTERETRARIDERLKMLSEAVSAAEPVAEKVEPEVEPDPDADIFGAHRFLKGKVQSLEQMIQSLRGDTAEDRAARAEETRTRQVVSTYVRDRDVFVSKQPDFMDAYNFLLGTRKQQLEAQRYSPEEVSKWLYTEEMNLVNRALEAKTSPSADIYNLAKSMGYTPKAAAAAAAAPAAGAPPAAGAKPAPAAPLAAVANVTDEIDRIKAGKQASISLSNGGGSAGEELSLEWLANAPLKEFEAFMEKPGNRAKVERAMGSQAA